MNVKTVLIEADGSGDFSYDRPFTGQILGIKVSQGTLGSSFDVSVTDVDQEADLLAVTGLSGDSWYQPLVIGCNDDGSPVSSLGGHVPPVIIGRLGITVANADADGKGFIRFVLA